MLTWTNGDSVATLDADLVSCAFSIVEQHDGVERTLDFGGQPA